MLRPRGQPRIYRQGNTWHLRVYVPQQLKKMVGKAEIHKSMETEDSGEAMARAEIKRRELFEWFNELNEAQSKEVEVVDELSSDVIADIARSVYIDFRAEVDDEQGDFLLKSPEEQKGAAIPEEERPGLLRDLLDHFDPITSAKARAPKELKKRGISVDPGCQSYLKLIDRVREAFIQVHVDAVNNLVGTPGRDDSPFFVDPVTKEPVTPSGKDRRRPKLTHQLGAQADQLVKEVSNSRGAKGVAKIQNTLALMMDWFGEDRDIRDIGRADVLEFRDALRNVPTNMAKRYPGKSMVEAIEDRSPEHDVLSISSVNTHMRNVVQLFANASRYDDEFRSPNLTKIALIDPVDEQDKRLPFSTEELGEFFPRILTLPAAEKRSSFFWIAAIGLYHGLRSNEIATLSPEDFRLVYDHQCIDLKLPKAIKDGFRKGKSKTIPRKLPLHPVLQRAGLLQFVETQKGHEYLFPCLSVGDDGYRSREVSRWASSEIKGLGWADRKLSFHSFRHSFKDAMDETDMSEKWKAYIGGWRLPGTMNKNYGSKEMKESIIPAVTKITMGEIDYLIPRLAAQL